MDARCEVCGKDLTDFSDHGARTNVGICQTRGAQDAEHHAAAGQVHHAAIAAHDVNPVHSDDDQHVPASEDAASADAEPPTFATPADEKLAEMYGKYPALTVGVINDFIGVANAGPLSFRDATQLMSKLDELPGTAISLER